MVAVGLSAVCVVRSALSTEAPGTQCRGTPPTCQSSRTAVPAFLAWFSCEYSMHSPLYVCLQALSPRNSGSVFLGHSANLIPVDFRLHCLFPLSILWVFFSSWGLFRKGRLVSACGFLKTIYFVIEWKEHKLWSCAPLCQNSGSPLLNSYFTLNLTFLSSSLFVSY